MKPGTRTQPVYLPPSIEDCLTDTPAAVGAGARRTLSRLWATLQIYGSRWWSRYRLRQSLREVDSYRVEKDIGVPLGYLSEEAHKPFWRE